MLEIPRSASFPEGDDKILVKFSKLLMNLKTHTHISLTYHREINFFLWDFRRWILAQVHQKLSVHTADFHLVPEHQWLIHIYPIHAHFCACSGTGKMRMGLDKEHRRENALKWDRQVTTQRSDEKINPPPQFSQSPVTAVSVLRCSSVIPGLQLRSNREPVK